MTTSSFIGEISILPYTFAPRDYSWCNGQYIPISQNPTLYSLIGTLYGGNGSTIFALPNLKGRAPIAWGAGPGLTTLPHPGYTGGSATVVLYDAEIPGHTHTLTAVVNPNPTDDLSDPSVTYSVARDSGGTFHEAYYKTATQDPDTQFADEAVTVAGANQGHANRQPYLGMNFCIAMDGIYPSRN